MQGSRITMPSSELSNLHSAGPMPVSPGQTESPKPSGAWLGSQSVFDQRDDRKLGRALSVSIIVHSIPVAVLLWLGAHQIAPQIFKEPPMKFDFVFVKTPPGPGGG